MSYITLADAKKHLAVIHSADDDLIQDKLDQAEDYAAQYMGRTDISDDQDWNLDGVPASSSSSGELVPASVVGAILLIMTDLYEFRSQTVAGVTPIKMAAAENMLHFFRKDLGI